MRAACFLVGIILLATQCVTTTTASDGQAATIARVSLPELGERPFYIRSAQYETISACLSSGHYRENLSRTLHRKVVNHPSKKALYRELEENVEVSVRCGVNPQGEVVMSQVKDYAGNSGEEVAQKMAVLVLDYRFEADDEASCLYFTTLTVSFELTARSVWLSK